MAEQVNNLNLPKKQDDQPLEYKVHNMDEARLLFGNLEKGLIKPEHEEAVRAGLTKFTNYMKLIQQAKAEGRGVIDDTNFKDDELSAGWIVWDRFYGAMEALTTIGSSALSEPTAGIAGAFSTLVAGSEAGTTTINNIREAMTFVPRTDEGKEFLQTLAVPLKKLDDAAYQLSGYVGGDNPLAATLVYTTLMGSIDLIGLKYARGARLRALNKNYLKTIDVADNLGINLRNVTGPVTGARVSANAAKVLPNQVIEAGRRMSPENRHASAAALREELLNAEFNARKVVKRAEGVALSTAAQMKGSTLKTFVQQATAKLVDQGFDLPKMKSVQARLKELDAHAQKPRAENSLIQLSSSSKVAAAKESAHMASLSDLASVRRRIDKTLLQRKENLNLPDTVNESVALRNLQKQIDDFVQQQFNKDMISGDKKALGQWKRANKLRREYNSRFNSDKAIRQLMDLEATPEQMARWLLGTNAVSSGNLMAAKVVYRLKDILGPDSPGIRGIKQSITYDIISPLLQKHAGPAQLAKVLENVSEFKSKHSSLIKALDFNMKDLNALGPFADVASRITPGPPIMSIKGVIKSVAALAWGHGIAKGGVKVRVGTGVLSLASRSGEISGKQLIHSLSEAMYGTPIVNRTGYLAARVIEGEFRSNLEAIDQAGKSDSDD